MADINTIEDEDVLHKMLSATEDFDERKKLRARMRVVREAKSGSDQITLDARKKREGECKEESVLRSTKTEPGADGGMVTTTTTTTTQKSKDGASTVTKQTRQVTQVGGMGGTTYGVSKTTAGKAGGRGGAMAAFKQMDSQAAPPGGAKPNAAVNLKRSHTWHVKDGPDKNTKPLVNIRKNAVQIKEEMLQFCQANTAEYEGVNITNFSSSWNDGMAFCALIHHFYPDSFDFSKLNPKNRRGNFTLAFDKAEKLGDVAPLLEVDDMVRMKNPDWKCVFTQVQMYYRRFRNHPDNAQQKKEEEQ